MKRGWKNFWITCGVVAGIGCVCLVSGKVMGATLSVMDNYIPDWIGPGRGEVDVAYDYGDTPLEADTDQTYHDVRSLKLDTEGLDVQILRGTGEGVKVQTEDIYSALKFQVTEEDGELKVETKARRFPWRINQGNYGNVWIYIPEDLQLEAADLQMGIGELYVENIDAGELKMEVGAGTAALDWFTADELDVEVGVGTVEASGDTRQQADLECGVGSLVYTAAGKEADFNYSLECGVGELNVGVNSYSGLGVEQTVDNRAQKTMNIVCDVGSTEIYFEE